jgi:hypothetical protein
MYEKISERSGGKYNLWRDRQLTNLIPQIALDDRIDELADLVRQHYGLAELGDPSTSTDVGHLVQLPRYLYQVSLGRNCCSRSYHP